MLEANVAVIKVDTFNIPVHNQYGGNVTNEVFAPKAEGSIQLNFDREEQQFGVRTKLAGGFQQYTTFKEPPDQKMDTVSKDDWSLDIKSFVIPIHTHNLAKDSGKNQQALDDFCDTVYGTVDKALTRMLKKLG